MTPAQLSGYVAGSDGPAAGHFTITPADSDLPRIPRLLWVTADGELSLMDNSGTTIVYPAVAGMTFPFRVLRVNAATTATVVGWD